MESRRSSSSRRFGSLDYRPGPSDAVLAVYRALVGRLTSRRRLSCLAATGRHGWAMCGLGAARGSRPANKADYGPQLAMNSFESSAPWIPRDTGTRGLGGSLRADTSAAPGESTASIPTQRCEPAPSGGCVGRASAPDDLDGPARGRGRPRPLRARRGSAHWQAVLKLSSHTVPDMHPQAVSLNSGTQHT